MQKLKSIILCTFNEVNFISETILEIKKNLSNCEIIIVDDNSTDGTIDKINNLNFSKNNWIGRCSFSHQNTTALNYQSRS